MIRSFVVFLALLCATPAFAETQTVKAGRVRYALIMSGMAPARASLVQNAVSNILEYDTAAELLAASPRDGVLGYALDTDAFYVRANSSWVGLISASGIQGSNGGTIDNETNNAWIFGENSEDLILTFGSDLVTLSSSTGALLAFTPAASFAGDVTLNGGAGALTFGAASSSVVVPDNSATALILGAAGALSMITLDSTNGAESIDLAGAVDITGPLGVTGDSTLTGDVSITGDSLLTGGLAVSDTIDEIGFAEGFGYGAGKGLATLQMDGTAFDGTAGVHNIAYTGQGHSFLYAAIVGQTLDLAMTATGLNIGMDQVDNDGVEIWSGVLGSSGRPFVVGTDPAFQFCASFSIADVSGTDDFHVGFREVEPFNAAVDSYTDFASLSIVTVADPAAIQIETNLAAAGTVTTDTTDTLADGVATVWCVQVDAIGAVTYSVDGSPPSTVAAYSFSDGLLVVPFVQVVQANAAQTGELNITNWVVGPQ